MFLFGIAGWESAKHGWNQLTASGHGGGHAGEAVNLLFFSYTPPAWLEPVWVNYTVLIGAFVFETWALYKARAEMQRQMDRNDWESYTEAFKKTSDVTTLTALTEDTIALVGIVIALVGITLEQLTDNAVFDQVSALLIGIMLMTFALALAWQNKRLLLGESLQPDEEAELRDVVTGHAGVRSIRDFRTVYFGPRDVLVTADVAFEEGLSSEEVHEHITSIQDQLRAVDDGIRRIYIEPEI